ncbi:uncharacterized protein LOC134747074 [Cydia strobilella]|uniref:uncharacterized protein LOC134747074 n=1 Tax=Cydia strobilella TaxID=1100964 RepID=UPI0030044BF2
MPNNYKRKTDRGEVSIEIYKLAAEEVTLRGKSLRDAAKSYNLNYSSLYRFLQKKKKNNDMPVTMGYVHNSIFTPEEEQTLAEYFVNCAAANYGLSTKDARRLAYQLAKKYNKKFPPTWESNEMAGEVWLRLYMQRHPSLSLRAPQATSLARATSFNEANVKLFFDNYTQLLDKHKFSASDIWNMDETGVTTVQKPNRVIARRGDKQVSAMTSAERRTLVTVALAVNAIGNHLPPMFIFPRKRFQDHFIRDGPVGSVGSGNASGWMQEEDFHVFLQHFHGHARSSPDKKALLILDNHSSHVAVNNITFCKDNGIVLLTFPPHCTHKLQPLDRAVFGPLKKAINTSEDSWMRTNPARTMTIYDVPGIVKTAMDVAVTGRNITSGFSACGIWPLNPNIFTAQDFLPSQVTDRPLNEMHPRATENQGAETRPTLADPVASTSTNSAPDETSVPRNSTVLEHDSPLPQPTHSRHANMPTPPPVVDATQLNHEPEETVSSMSESGVDTSAARPNHELGEPIPSGSNVTASDKTPVKIFTPEIIRPLPKALPRKCTQNRRKVKSAILTDTPEKEALEAIEANRKLKNVKKRVLNDSKQLNITSNKKKATNQNKRPTKNKKKQTRKSDSENDDDDCLCLCCLESYKNSRPNEEWVQCMECKGWAHAECTTGELNYICQNCLSD